ncbi:PWI domain-containing protein [Xylariales sp. PMI_506]|nr:PWI domain-containing protein [Xylariales sp. PMI_506]
MAATVDMKLLRATKFPPEFNQKVDMQKVNLQVMKKWIAGKIADILGSEDDVVTELCFNLIEGSRFPDIKAMQIQLTGFLEKETPAFCKELWKLFLSAQSSPQGVPQELLEAKKLELIQEKIEADKAAEEARLRRENQEQNAETEGSVAVVVITGVVGGVAAIEHTRTVAAALGGAAGTDLIRLREGGLIVAIVIDMCLKVVTRALLVGDVHPPGQHLQTREAPSIAHGLARVLAVIAVGDPADLRDRAVGVVRREDHHLEIEMFVNDLGPDLGGEMRLTGQEIIVAETHPRRVAVQTRMITDVRVPQRGGGIPVL